MSEVQVDGAAESAAGNIEVEKSDQIHVGAGGTLVVPREDLGAEIEEGTGMDISAGLPKKAKKPSRREWFMLRRLSEITTRLLRHKPNPQSPEEELYYVAPNLRLPIHDELRAVRVFQYFSLATKLHSLWVITVSPENPWYESINLLLRQPVEFFDRNAIRVISDRDAGYYRVRYKPVDVQVVWPTSTTEQLLGEALGPGRFITSTDHPVYADLVAGKELA